MKILQIMAGAAEGGAEFFFVDALQALKQAGIEQYVITRSNNPERLTQLRALNIPVETASFNKVWPWGASAHIRRAIREFKPDIVQYWMGRAASLTVHGDHVNIGWHSSYNKLKRFKKCDYHIGVTQDVADHVINQGVPPDHAFSLPIYTHKPNVEPVSREPLGTPEGVPLLLSLSRLHPVKGLDILLKAMLDIPDAYLWIAGSGPLEAELKAQTAALNLQNRVRFLGWREDGSALMAAADISVFPSRNDSFGAVMIESWASGTPLIATKSPGPKAYVHHEEDGILTEIDDVKGLFNAINRLIDDPELVQKIKKNGTERFEKEFTQEAFVKGALEIYNTVLGL